METHFLNWTVHFDIPAPSVFLRSEWDDLAFEISTSSSEDSPGMVYFDLYVYKGKSVVHSHILMVMPQEALIEAELWLQSAVVGRINGRRVPGDEKNAAELS